MKYRNESSNAETPTISENEHAHKLANFFVLALNEGDLQSFISCLEHMCIPDVKFIFHVYNCKNFIKGIKKPFNLFGEFSSGQLTYTQVIDLYINFLQIVPDFNMKLFSSRCCYDREVSVYISSFRAAGTIISKDSTLVESDSKGRIRSLKSISEDILLESAKEGFNKPFSFLGSLIFYKNKDGRVTTIEWYYEFAEC